jgi:uncharacterized spore protein YtfJ
VGEGVGSIAAAVVSEGAAGEVGSAAGAGVAVVPQAMMNNRTNSSGVRIIALVFLNQGFTINDTSIL